MSQRYSSSLTSSTNHPFIIEITSLSLGNLFPGISYNWSIFVSNEWNTFAQKRFDCLCGHCQFHLRYTVYPYDVLVFCIMDNSHVSPSNVSPLRGEALSFSPACMFVPKASLFQDVVGKPCLREGAWSLNCIEWPIEVELHSSTASSIACWFWTDVCAVLLTYFRFSYSSKSENTWPSKSSRLRAYAQSTRAQHPSLTRNLSSTSLKL